MDRSLSYLLVFAAAACTHTPLLRNLDATATLSCVPSRRDVTATVSLVARPVPPPVRAQGEPLSEPTVPASRLDGCRSRYGLCRYERVSIARAIAEARRAP